MVHKMVIVLCSLFNYFVIDRQRIAKSHPENSSETALDDCRNEARGICGIIAKRLADAQLCSFPRDRHAKAARNNVSREIISGVNYSPAIILPRRSNQLSFERL